MTANKQPASLPPELLAKATKATRAYRRSLEFADDWDDESAAIAALTAADVPELLAEVERLRGEADNAPLCRDHRTEKNSFYFDGCAAGEVTTGSGNLALRCGELGAQLVHLARWELWDGDEEEAARLEEARQQHEEGQMLVTANIYLVGLTKWAKRMERERDEARAALAALIYQWAEASGVAGMLARQSKPENAERYIACFKQMDEVTQQARRVLGKVEELGKP